MEATVPLILSAAWAAGVNSYATVALLCVASRADLLELPAAFARTDVLVVAVVLFLVEFVTDKVPWLDSAWDAVHTVVRPLIGGTVGAALAGYAGASDGVQALAGGGSGVTTLASHATKASIRLAINTSPEPFTNVAMSLVEDMAVAGVILLATDYPWVAAAIAMTLLVAGGALAVYLGKRVRRGLARLQQRRAGPPSPT